MGLLDWVKTPEGQALASAVAGYAANARRGQPINSIGLGLGAGIGAYGNALQSQEAARQREIQNAYNQRMMGYNERQAETSALKAETDRKRAEQKFRELKGLADADVKMFGAMFPGQKFQSNILDDDYEIINAVWDDGTPAQGMTVAQAKEKAVIPEFKVNEGMAKMYGFTPEDLQYVQGIYAMDPKSAIKEMAEIRKATRKGGKEARDAIAKERAIAEAMGMDVGDYLKQKFNKPSGVNVTVQNYGEPKAVQLPDGTQGLVRFSKDPNAPPMVTPFQPPASDTEQMTAGYASRMANSEKIIRNLGSKGNPSWTTSIVGGVAGEPGRSIAMSAEQQRHRQAQEDWVRAKLRKESGAVIADDEMEREIRTYFPQPWDKPETIKQKEQARQVAIDSMNKTAGPAMARQPAKPAQQGNPAQQGVRKYNPATGRIE